MAAQEKVFHRESQVTSLVRWSPTDPKGQDRDGLKNIGAIDVPLLTPLMSTSPKVLRDRVPEISLLADINCRWRTLGVDPKKLGDNVDAVGESTVLGNPKDTSALGRTAIYTVMARARETADRYVALLEQIWRVVYRWIEHAGLERGNELKALRALEQEQQALEAIRAADPVDLEAFDQTVEAMSRWRLRFIDAREQQAWAQMAMRRFLAMADRRGPFAGADRCQRLYPGQARP